MKRLLKAAIESTHAFEPYRWMQRQKALILMYHGLTSNRACREWNQVHVEEFERQIAYVKNRYRIVSLRALVEDLEQGELPRFTAAITFDDGYRSVYALADPILRRHAIPYTVFLTTEYLAESEDEPRYLWTDLVGALLEAATEPRLDLRNFGLGVYDLSNPARARAARGALAEPMKLLPSKTKNDIVEHLAKRFGQNLDHHAHEIHRPMTWSEARALAGDARITIGGHTRTHPILSRTEEPLLEDEILGGKRDLELRLGVEVTEFAYPNGRRIDFDERSLRVVRSGFRNACTTVEGLNAPGADVFLLKRMPIGGDLSFGGFKAMISGVYSFAR